MHQCFQSLSTRLCICAALLAVSQPGMAANHKASADSTLELTIAPYIYQEKPAPEPNLARSRGDTASPKAKEKPTQYLIANGRLLKWRNASHANTIKGLNFQQGYRYTIRVKKQSPCSHSTYDREDKCQYTLLRTLSKEKADLERGDFVLEVYYAIEAENSQQHVGLFALNSTSLQNRYRMYLDTKKHGRLQAGDRIKIANYYIAKRGTPATMGNENPIQLLYVGNMERLPNPSKTECESEGGRWEALPLRFGISTVCEDKPYTDAGKACTASSQCQGLCVTYHSTFEKKRWFNKYEGACSKQESVDRRCRPYTVEHAQAGEERSGCMLLAH